MKTSAEIRAEFLDFFKTRGHRIVPSSPLVPSDDPTLLFINAGMNQFKDVFLETGTRPYKRAADTQKCIRVSGKHNDLEEVGRDTYHHTFFEMLGNWSFGDYFKADAIRWAWELLTEVWKIPKHAIWITVFGGDEKDGLGADEEAEHLWISETGVSPDRVLRFGKKDNFWEMGEVGPCGPCSEIHIDLQAIEDASKAENSEKLVNSGDPSVIEIWNLVFMQYNRREDGKLVALPSKHVDTGMGLERLVMLIQGKTSNYDTDLFTPILDKISAISGKKYRGTSEMVDVAFRVVADHVRAMSVAFADGVLPGNSGRGYVLRRLLRRAARFARQKLEMADPFMYRLVPTVASIFRDAFPEIEQRKKHIELLIRSEEESFSKMLSRGIDLFAGLANEVKKNKAKLIPGDKAYQLYHQDGFPKDLVKLMAEEQGLAVDENGWREAEKLHRKRSSGGGKASYQVAPADLEGMPASKFLGYLKFEGNGKILKLLGNDKLILDQTPFYAESGGQVADTGIICSNNFEFVVRDTQKFGDIYVHFGELKSGDLANLPTRVTSYVDKERRRKTMANHTATHLLHWALRKVLGDHAAQQGSLVAPDRLRFDFSHPTKISDQDLREIEKLVNARICDNLTVGKKEESFEQAKKKGAMALFGEKYGDTVKVITIGRYSKELCGGTHSYATGELGCFQIVSESAVQAGVRRIEAITRDVALMRIQAQKQLVDTIKDMLRSSEDEMLIKRLVSLQEKIKMLKKREGQQANKNYSNWRDELLEKSIEKHNVKIVVCEIESTSSSEMRLLSDLLRKSPVLSTGFLVSRFEGKILLVAFVSKKLSIQGNIHAGELMKMATAIVGGGGDSRRAEFSQGQGKNAAKLEEMMAAIFDAIETKLATSEC